MIRPAPTRLSRAPARCYWHPFFVIWPRTVDVTDEYGGSMRVKVFFEPMMRRWSGTQRRWLWAMPGTRAKGARP